MPVRMQKIRPMILLALAFLGVQAGLAAGPFRADAGGSGPQTAPSIRAAMVTPAPPATDALAATDAPATSEAPAAPVSAATLVPADRLYLEPILTAAAREYGVPVDMILAQAWAESSWRIDAVSNKGAVGVLQLMPKAVDFVSKNLLKLDQPLDALDPASNARMGARYMRHLLDRTDGDMRAALMAYNQGLSGLRRKGPVPAAEAYADKVLALLPVFAV